MPETLVQEIEEFFGQSEKELRVPGAKSHFEFPDGRNCRAFVLRLYRAARALELVEMEASKAARALERLERKGDGEK